MLAGLRDRTAALSLLPNSFYSEPPVEKNKHNQLTLHIRHTPVDVPMIRISNCSELPVEKFLEGLLPKRSLKDYKQDTIASIDLEGIPVDLEIEAVSEMYDALVSGRDRPHVTHQCIMV